MPKKKIFPTGSVNLNFRVSNELYTKIEAEASRWESSTSEIARRILIKHFERGE